MKLWEKVVTVMVPLLIGYALVQFKADPKIILYVCGGIFLFLLVYFWIGLDKPDREPVPQWMKDQILQKQNHHCITCSRTEFLDFHHRIAVAQGGKNTTSNIVAICAACHAAITRASQTKIATEA